MRNAIALLFSLIFLLVFISISSAQPTKTIPPRHYDFPLGNEVLPDVPVYPYIPDAATYTYIIGFTYWDLQSIGSPGDRIAFCNNGSSYYTWTNLAGWPHPPVPVHAFYNWRLRRDRDFEHDNNGLQVSEETFSGFPSLACLSNNTGVIAYHNIDGDGIGRIIVSIEWDPPGLGIFNHYEVPNQIFPQTPEYPGICYWPQVAVDRDDNIHIVMHENCDSGPFRIAYTRSEDEGATWTEPIVIDTCTVVGAVINASDSTDQVIVAWPKPYDLNSQWLNDIVYVTSEDGLSWDFENDVINITDYANDSDSLWAYCDIDILAGTNTYITWIAQWVTDEGVYWPTFLLLYDENQGQITEINHHPDSLFEDICGAWNRPICKPSLAIRTADSTIIACWTQYDTSDVSARGYGNGDIYLSFSHDNIYWFEEENITHTFTPHCFPGECGSENRASVSQYADDSLQMVYIKDMDAGSVIMGEGAATENPVLYHTHWPTGLYENGFLNGVVTEIDGEIPVEGATIRILQSDSEVARCTTDWQGYYSITIYCGYYSVEASKEGYQTEIIHNVGIPPDWPIELNFSLVHTVGIEPDVPIPLVFRLDQNHPNPFNVSTNISFSLKDAGPVRLEIIDITGALVETLIDGFMLIGDYDITWNADDYSSGAYIYRLKSSGNTLVRKAILIK